MQGKSPRTYQSYSPSPRSAKQITESSSKNGHYLPTPATQAKWRNERGAKSHRKRTKKPWRKRQSRSWRYSFHKYFTTFFYLFLFFNYFTLSLFFDTFFTHDIYPHPHPRPTPTTSTHDPRHLATLLMMGRNIFFLTVHENGTWSVGFPYMSNTLSSR